VTKTVLAGLLGIDYSNVTFGNALQFLEEEKEIFKTKKKNWPPALPTKVIGLAPFFPEPVSR
jgi:hypothetical protein